jgi:hypothetical protein
MNPPRVKRVVRLFFAALLAAATQPVRAAAQTTAPHAQGTTTPSAQSTTTSQARDRGITGSITGRLVGEGGEPLAQVTVFLSGRSAGAPTQRTATTDDEGNFVFADLQPGIYSVFALAPGYYSETAAQGEAASAGLRLGDSTTLRLTKGGVITGAVTDPNGGPIVALPVRAYRVRALEGEPAGAVSPYLPFGSQTQTDDRGIYRIFGLTPGVYVVAAGGAGAGPISPYEGDSPTFYPSSTADTAAEVTVRAGQEAVGVDISYRDERGQRVSGELQFPADLRDMNAGARIMLVHAATGSTVAASFASARDAERRFQLDGVADGDYELRAVLTTPDGVTRSSTPLPISVRGADMTGLRLVLAPLGSLSGTLVVETPPAPLRESELCRAAAPAPRLLAQEVLLTARRDDERAAGSPQRPGQFTRSTASPDETGAFTLRNLEAGRYRLQVRPLDESLYVRSVQLPAPAPTVEGNAPRTAGTTQTARAGATGAARTTGATGPGIAAGRGPVTLRTGQQVSGVVARVAYGAALLGGRLTAPENAPENSERAEGAGASGSHARVYLVPAEAERTDDLLGYAETNTTSDGAFVFRNIPPGRYLLAVRAAAVATPTPERPPFWDAAGRAALRREAEAARFAFGLQPCQRLTGVALPFRPTAATQD